MSKLVLQMPNSYVEIERDEMEYVDGGGEKIYAIVWAAVASSV